MNIHAHPGFSFVSGGDQRTIVIRRAALSHNGAQWNWPSSVEPLSAVVELLGSTVVAMRSK